MGQFSWFTQDTKRRIRNGVPFTVYMTDDKGNKYKETCYGGYGVFGGKDYYELLAEMNGIVDRNKEYLRQIGIELAFKNSPQGYNPEAPLTDREWFLLPRGSTDFRPGPRFSIRLPLGRGTFPCPYRRYGGSIAKGCDLY